jgi:hypothetical protein
MAPSHEMVPMVFLGEGKPRRRALVVTIAARGWFAPRATLPLPSPACFTHTSWW